MNSGGISGLSSYFKLKLRVQQEFPVSSLFFFTGLLNASFPLWLFIYLNPILMSTAVLICMENTFWNISKDGNFVKSFKKSFTSYVDSGMRMKAEAEIDILQNVQGGSLYQATNLKDFNPRFCKLIIEHYLRKFHCFYVHLTHLTTSFLTYSPL